MNTRPTEMHFIRVSLVGLSTLCFFSILLMHLLSQAQISYQVPVESHDGY